MTLSQLRMFFPTLHEWHTGGGFMALRMITPGGGYLLLTVEGGRIPAETDSLIEAGTYDGEGQPTADVIEIAIDAMPAWLLAQVSRGIVAAPARPNGLSPADRAEARMRAGMNQDRADECTNAEPALRALLQGNADLFRRLAE